MLLPYLSFSMCCLCQWFHEVFGFKVCLRPQWGCFAVLYSVLLHVLDFITRKWWSIVTSDNIWNSMGREYSGIIALAEVEYTMSTSGNREYASMITLPKETDHKNPCERCAKALAAMETSEEDLDDFQNCWLGKQYTYLVSVSHCHQFQETKPFHEIVASSSPGLDDPHEQLKLLCFEKCWVSQYSCHEG